MTAIDLRFYDFEAGAPVEHWHSVPPDASSAESRFLKLYLLLVLALPHTSIW
jgi:hypothetical protein